MATDVETLRCRSGVVAILGLQDTELSMFAIDGFPRREGQVYGRRGVVGKVEFDLWVDDPDCGI